MEPVGINLNYPESGWNVFIDGPEKKQIESTMTNIEAYERDKIYLTAAKILSNCPNPQHAEGLAKGLALGKVQSGKTGSFISLGALAFDNKYRIVIVIAGTKKNLLEQNRKRINKQLNLEYRTDRKIASLSTSSRISEVQAQQVRAILESGSNILLTVLKHHDHINHIASIFDDPELSSYPVLIIDDEGDQASLNTKHKKGKKSPTYDEITKLINVFKIRAYVAFTATPQANLLINTIDELSPDFCVLIEPGLGYTGGSTFHGVNQDRYIRVIPESDLSFEDHLPDTLKKALSTFFVGGAIRSLRNDDEYHSMLVHTSGTKNDHHQVGDKIRALVENWKQKILLPPHDPARGSVVNYLFDAYQDIVTHGESELPTWDNLISQIKDEITHLMIWIVNSSPKAESPTDKLHLKNNIFIGGNMLERGVTLDGLAVTYITRRAKAPQADTVEQRARWFGYKKKYLDTCRVFAPQNVKDEFSYLLGDEDDLWESLKLNEAEDLDIKLWSRIVQCSAPFKPTRSNVASVKEVDYERFTMQDKVELASEIASHNVEVIRNFFNEVNATETNFGGTIHSVLSNYQLFNVVDKLIPNLKSSRTDDESYVIINTVFKRLLKLDQAQTIDIVLMLRGNVRTRGYDGIKIVQHMQGANKKYPGDRNFMGDTFHLQVHIIQPHQNGNPLVDSTVSLVLYVPTTYVDHLRRLVKPSGI